MTSGTAVFRPSPSLWRENVGRRRLAVAGFFALLGPDAVTVVLPPSAMASWRNLTTDS